MQENLPWTEEGRAAILKEAADQLYGPDPRTGYAGPAIHRTNRAQRRGKEPVYEFAPAARPSRHTVCRECDRLTFTTADRICRRCSL